MEEINNFKNDSLIQKKKSNVLLIVTATVAGLALIGCIILVVWNTKLNAKIVSLQTQDTKFKEVNDKLVSKQNIYDTEQSQIKTITYLSYLSHEIENSVVTDDFVVAKISFAFTDSKELNNITIDMDNQPQMALKYSGEGNYDIVDRQLRTKVIKLIKSAKTYYGENSDAPIWADSTSVKITVKNYDVGDYLNGEFKLAGEK